MTIAIQDPQAAEIAVNVPVIDMSAFDTNGVPTFRIIGKGPNAVEVNGRRYLFNGTNGYPAQLHVEWQPRTKIIEGKPEKYKYFSAALTKSITDIVDGVTVRKGTVTTWLNFELPDWEGVTDLAGLKNQIGNVYSATFNSAALSSGDPGLTTLQSWMNGVMSVKSA